MNADQIPVIYIAGPYRGSNAWEIEKNIRMAEELAFRVWTQVGAAALCPHTNARFFQGTASDDVWLAGDIALMTRCDAVLTTIDWARSRGAVAEVNEAMKRGMNVFHDIADLQAWIGVRFVARVAIGANTFGDLCIFPRCPAYAVQGSPFCSGHKDTKL